MPRYKESFKLQIPDELRARVDAICSIMDIPIKDACTEALSWWVAKYGLIAEDRLEKASPKKGRQETLDAMQSQEWLQLTQPKLSESGVFCDIDQKTPELE